MLFSRSLLYTGITRAEKLVTLIGKEEVLSFMVENDYRSVRYTGLSAMFQNIANDTNNYLAEDTNLSDEEERNDIEVDEFTAIDWNDIIDT